VSPKTFEFGGLGWLFSQPVKFGDIVVMSWVPPFNFFFRPYYVVFILRRGLLTTQRFYEPLKPLHVI
jgi:hypothetical protein